MFLKTLGCLSQTHHKASVRAYSQVRHQQYPFSHQGLQPAQARWLLLYGDLHRHKTILGLLVLIQTLLPESNSRLQLFLTYSIRSLEDHQVHNHSTRLMY